MRLGLFIPSVSPIATPEYLGAFAEAAEEGGFASIWMGEHVVNFDDYESRYPYSDDGRIGLPPETGHARPLLHPGVPRGRDRAASGSGARSACSRSATR